MEGERIEIRGFGCFTVREYVAYEKESGIWRKDRGKTEKDRRFSRSGRN
jgi:hypothetical protein